TFVLKSDGTLKQNIAPRVTLPLSFVDMHDLPEYEQELRVSHLVDQEKHWTFDLARGPLLRATIIYQQEDEHILLLTCHAIILDGWATEVLLHEMAQLYTAFVENMPSPLPALPLQYADYACWQRAILTNEVLEHLQEYWTKQLTNLPTLTLPTDRPRPMKPTFGAAILPIEVSTELTGKLKTLSKREGT